MPITNLCRQRRRSSPTWGQPLIRPCVANEVRSTTKVSDRIVSGWTMARLATVDDVPNEAIATIFGEQCLGPTSSLGAR